jgi:hypothetical protein
MNFKKKKKKKKNCWPRSRLELGTAKLAIVILTLVMLSIVAPFYVSFEHCSIV